MDAIEKLLPSKKDQIKPSESDDIDQAVLVDYDERRHDRDDDDDDDESHHGRHGFHQAGGVQCQSQ